MFRAKQNTDQKQKNKNNVLNNNESSTDECSNQRNSIYQLNKKQLSNIEIFRYKIPSQDITPIISSEKRKLDLKDDSFIHEIINSDDDNKSKVKGKIINLIDDKIKNKNDFKIDKNKSIKNKLMSKNSLKKNFNNTKDYLMDGLLKKNIIKKNKRKNWINLNKLKLNDNIIQFFNPTITNRQSNNLVINSKEMNKDQDSNKLENISFSEYKFKNIEEIKNKNIEKILKIVNDNYSYYNINNSIQNTRQHYESSIYNKFPYINKPKRTYTLDNNLKLDKINNKPNKNDKKLTLKLYNSNNQRTYNKKREKNSSCDHGKLKFKNSATHDFFRNNNFNNIYFNTIIDFSKKKVINRNNIQIFQINRSNSLDSPHSMIKIPNDKKDNINKKIIEINEYNYKSKLNDIKKRMTSLIDKLINYIEILKEDK